MHYWHSSVWTCAGYAHKPNLRVVRDGAGLFYKNIELKIRSSCWIEWKSFRMAPPLFYSIWNNIVSNLPQWDIFFEKMSEKVVAPYGKLSELNPHLILKRGMGSAPEICLTSLPQSSKACWLLGPGLNRYFMNHILCASCTPFLACLAPVLW